MLCSSGSAIPSWMFRALRVPSCHLVQRRVRTIQLTPLCFSYQLHFERPPSLIQNDFFLAIRYQIDAPDNLENTAPAFHTHGSPSTLKREERCGQWRGSHRVSLQARGLSLSASLDRAARFSPAPPMHGTTQSRAEISTGGVLYHATYLERGTVLCSHDDCVIMITIT